MDYSNTVVINTQFYKDDIPFFEARQPVKQTTDIGAVVNLQISNLYQHKIIDNLFTSSNTAIMGENNMVSTNYSPTRLASYGISQNIYCVDTQPINRFASMELINMASHFKNKEKELKEQIKNIKMLVEEKDKMYITLLNKYIEESLSIGKDIIDIMFELYSNGLVSISEVRHRANLNQYKFVQILSEKKMNYNYPQISDSTKNERLERARKLLKKL